MKSHTEHLIEQLITLHYFELQDFVISPNDEEVLLIYGNTDLPHDEYAYEERNRSIWKLNITNGTFIPLTDPKDDAHHPVYSSSGDKIAYLSRQSGQKELWSMDHQGKKQKQLTNSSFPGRDPFTDISIQWSANGRYIAYTVHPKGSFYGNILTIQNEAKQSTEIKIDRGETSHQENWNQARGIFRSSLYLYDTVAGINKRIIHERNQSLMIHDWYGDESLLISQGTSLIKLHLETGNEKVLYDDSITLLKVMNEDIFVVLFDGERLQTGYIYQKELVNKKEIELTNDGLLTIHNCSKDGRKIFFTDQQGLSNILYQADLTTGEITQLTATGNTVHEFLTCPALCQTFHQTDEILFPYSSPERPVELWKVGESLTLEQVSDVLAEKTPTNLPQTKIIRYESNGFEIESLLVLPVDYEVGKKYPTLIYLHGGPEDCIRANFTELISGRAESCAHLMAAHGYIVFMPNFRGSLGYGNSFLNELGNYQLMQAPYEDIMTGVDYLLDQGIAHENHLGIYGSSFGAILTAWTLAHTDRFKGAIGMVGTYDLLQDARSHNHSFHSISENRSAGTIPNDHWIRPDVYQKISPMEHYDKINTPLLFIETGAECESNQSEARPLFHALMARGVQSELIYYPEAYHNGGWNDQYKSDYMNRILSWFDDHLRSNP